MIENWPLVWQERCVMASTESEDMLATEDSHNEHEHAGPLPHANKPLLQRSNSVDENCLMVRIGRSCSVCENSHQRSLRKGPPGKSFKLSFLRMSTQLLKIILTCLKLIHFVSIYHYNCRLTQTGCLFSVNVLYMFSQNNLTGFWIAPCSSD